VVQITAASQYPGNTVPAALPCNGCPSSGVGSTSSS
jgi:hypothetical protein